MLIRIADFKGEIPRLKSRLLPVNYAQVANNTRLEDGAVGPIKASVTAHTFPSTPQTFMKFENSFISFDQINVKATVGPVAEDRLYFTGDGAPKMRINGTDYGLAVPTPTIRPALFKDAQEIGPTPRLTRVVINPPVADAVTEEFSYRYSAITDRGETVASEQSQTLRLDGERVEIDLMELPEGTETIRIYRLDLSKASGAAGRYGKLFDVEYDVGTHGPLTSAAVTDFFSVFPDVSISPKETGDDADVEEIVTYVYTFVTQFDEESAPSPASGLITVGPTDSVEYELSASVPAGRGIDRFRVYRSKTSLSGVTDFYFLTEHPIADGGIRQTDDLQDPLNETISSTDNDPPPDGMQGLISLPNGLMAAHTGREVLFCEPYKPHAWPIKYRRTTDTDIVGLGAFGTFLVVMTKGAPYLIQGSDPSLMISEKLEVTLPCLSARSIVDMGYSVAYASHDGLVTVSERGAEVVTRNLFTDELWRSMQPSSFRAAQRNGRYNFSHLPSGAGALQFGIIDLSREQPYFITADISATSIYYDAFDGALYYVEGSSVVRQFDPRGGAIVAKQTWRSKLVVLQGYDNFGALLVETDDVPGTKETPADPDCLIRIYADGDLVHTTTDINIATRLPSGFLANTWEIEIEGYAPVTGISLASDIAEFVGN